MARTSTVIRAAPIGDRYKRALTFCKLCHARLSLGAHTHIWFSGRHFLCDPVRVRIPGCSIATNSAQHNPCMPCLSVCLSVGLSACLSACIYVCPYAFTQRQRQCSNPAVSLMLCTPWLALGICTAPLCETSIPLGSQQVERLCNSYLKCPMLVICTLPVHSAVP